MFIQGLSAGRLIFGTCCGLIGIGFFLAAFVCNYALSISNFALPQWIMYTAAIALLIVGTCLAKDAFNT